MSIEKRIYLTNGEFGSIGATADSSSIILQSNKSMLHHFDVRWKALDSKDMRWLMDFNLTFLTNSQYNYALPNQLFFGSLNYSVYPQNTIGDIPGARLSWTGGWVNRWQLGDFTAGLDLLYHFGETLPSFSAYGVNTGTRVTSVLVPNIYAGYRWKLGAGMLELFLESRGLARSKTSYLLDDRRYYTVGGSYSL